MDDRGVKQPKLPAIKIDKVLLDAADVLHIHPIQLLRMAQKNPSLLSRLLTSAGVEPPAGAKKGEGEKPVPGASQAGKADRLVGPEVASDPNAGIRDAVLSAVPTARASGPGVLPRSVAPTIYPVDAALPGTPAATPTPPVAPAVPAAVEGVPEVASEVPGFRQGDPSPFDTTADEADRAQADAVAGVKTAMAGDAVSSGERTGSIGPALALLSGVKDPGDPRTLPVVGPPSPRAVPQSNPSDLNSLLAALAQARGTPALGR